MPYFVHGEDKPGVLPGLMEQAEAHWSYMDRFADRLVLRGPTLTDDAEEHAGSVHVLDVEDRETAERFAYEEPFWAAGFYHPLTIVRAVVLVDETAGVPKSLVTAEWAPTDIGDLQGADDRVSFLVMLVDDDGTRSVGVVAAVDALPAVASAIVQPVADGLRGEPTILTARRWQRGGRSQSDS
ncbi:YciI family protein [Kribbella sp. CA-293567]|uniref:YciI family protein n=1 Tax=Kribbella sp. CA-293567 TaxID=3002436 RepID=UPI0022DE7C80|nr:YciI family protein [Kribbella sp. CA-293567]WBQ02554.1 YciI family protein [Kribbella sp. CA-293567]